MLHDVQRTGLRMPRVTGLRELEVTNDHIKTKVSEETILT